VGDLSLYVMNPVEIAWGYLVGFTGSLPPASVGAPTDPRKALERVVRRSLEHPPCGVAFSGGRDSSTVLAVATHVARREGLPEPLPITRVFPDAPGTDESQWQEAVVRHLGLREWLRVRLHDELDLVGPLATPRLLEHGVIWPPTLQGDIPLLEPLQNGGSLLDGEGGDEVFGVEAHRIAAVRGPLRSPRSLRWRRLRPALGALAPSAVRVRHAARQYRAGPQLPWLRPATREELVRALAALEGERPLSFAASVQRVPTRRTQAVLAHNRRIFARRGGVEFTSPLLDPDVVRALAHDGGTLGRGDRTAVLRRLVPDLLPDALLARTSKATFGGAFMARHTRAFAEGWNGEGLDPELVEPEVLRASWLGDERNALTAALLQAAWLATEGPSARSGVG
jgi:asparagine synthetase B (glutamine-hydrolysing)